MYCFLHLQFSIGRVVICKDRRLLPRSKLHGTTIFANHLDMDRTRIGIGWQQAD
jgi:hypothetical protein